MASFENITHTGLPINWKFRHGLTSPLSQAGRKQILGWPQYSYLWNSFHFDILSHSNWTIVEVIAQIKATIYPLKVYTTKLNSSKIRFFSKKGDALRYTLHRIYVCIEFQVVFTNVCFAGFDNFLESLRRMQSGDCHCYNKKSPWSHYQPNSQFYFFWGY